jgi:hypothetical protein
MSDHLRMKQENLEMEELEENSMHHIVIKQEPQVFVNVNEIRDPELDIENFKEEMTLYPENKIDKSGQFSNGTDNDNLVDIEEGKLLKRKKIKKKTGNDNAVDIKEDKPLKMKKLKNKSMKHKNPANENLVDVSKKSSVDLPEPPAGLIENYYDLDLSVEFLSQLFTYVNELCEFINNGDQNINRTSVVIQNLNDAVSCYQDHLPLIEPTPDIKGTPDQEGFKYELNPPDFLESDEDFDPKKIIGEKSEKTGEKRGKYKTAEKSEICNICNKAFSKQHKLKKHIDIVHEKVQKHISTFHGDMPYSCDNCDAAFANKSKLNRHIASVHEEKKPYVCKICDTIFAVKQNLKKHIKTTHANILPLNFGVDAINELIKTDAIVEVKCEICCLDFKSNGKLKEHQNEKHKSGKQICCTYCDWKASEKQQAKSYIPSTIRKYMLMLWHMKENFKAKIDSFFTF